MARWHDFIFLWKIKLCILWENTVRMCRLFPLLEEKLDKLGSYKVKKTKNKVFDTTFADFS